MEVENFSVIEEEFQKRIAKIVWCTFTTIDTQGRPRSRMLHPVWEGSCGWIATGRQGLKAKHLANNALLIPIHPPLVLMQKANVIVAL